MLDQKKIGDCIAALRKSRGLTQAALADALCVTHQAVSKWENGTALPNIEILVAMRDLFGVSIDDLLDGNCGIAAKPPAEMQKPCIPTPSELRVEDGESREFADRVDVGTCVIVGKAFFREPFRADRLEVHGRAEFSRRLECDELDQRGELRACNDVTADRAWNAGSIIIEGEFTCDEFTNTGAVKCRQSMTCDSLHNTGALRLHNTITTDTMRNFGALNCHGTLTTDSLINYGAITSQTGYADEIHNTGAMTCHGEIVCDSLRNNGSIGVDAGLRADAVESNGSLQIGADLLCDKLRSGGDLSIRTNLRADKVELTGSFRIEAEIGARDVRITLSEHDCYAGRIRVENMRVERDRQGSTAVLRTEEITAQTVELSYVQCRLVTADKARIGDDCRIDRLECAEPPEISPNALVREIVTPDL